jgi:hypothetical protein
MNEERKEREGGRKEGKREGGRKKPIKILLELSSVPYRNLLSLFQREFFSFDEKTTKWDQRNWITDFKWFGARQWLNSGAY